MKRVIVIGATSAIAIACARIWAAQGSSFFLVARDADKLNVVAKDLLVRGAAEIQQYAMDAADIAGHRLMMEAAIGALERPDVALIAYGTLPDQVECEKNPSLAAQEMMTNGVSVASLLLVLAQYFETQKKGAIGVITSVAGDRGRPSNYVYGSAKGAVSLFCEGLRVRLFSSNVTVTDIRPGFVATPMTAGLPLPEPLVAQPDDVARRIVKGMDRGADVLYVPGFWAGIMWVIRWIPRFLFKRMKL